MKNTPINKDAPGPGWMRWTVEDKNAFKETLTRDQMGELFFAVMDYLETFELTEVSQDIRTTYRLMINTRATPTIVSYQKTCAANAENGRKGGQKKAENARKRLEESGETFKPHTKKAFVSRARDMIKNEEIGCEIGQAEEFFDMLKAQDWKIQGTPFRSRKDVEEVLAYRFSTDPTTGSGYRDYLIFGTLYARGADTTAIGDFFDHYDQDADAWTINGEEYSDKEAIEAFLANPSKP